MSLGALCHGSRATREVMHLVETACPGTAHARTPPTGGVGIFPPSIAIPRFALTSLDSVPNMAPLSSCAPYARPNHLALPRHREARRRRHGSRLQGRRH